MSGLRTWIGGVGVLGPGLSDWAQARETLSRPGTYQARATELPVPLRLPPAERRRAGAAVKLALAVADQATHGARLELSRLATVFTSSSGEGAICHQLCEALAAPAPLVSPTRFTNSVHNAAAGCWHIAVSSRAASTSLCAFDASFAAGLLEAAVSVQLSGQPILLVASDSPYPAPLHATRALPDHFGVALLLEPAATARTLASWSLELVGASEPVDSCDDPQLELLRRTIPAAAALPLLTALAGRARTVVLPGPGGRHLRVDCAPPPETGAPT